MVVRPKLTFWLFLQRGVFVAGLAEEIVMSPEHVLELMTNGEGEMRASL